MITLSQRALVESQLLDEGKVVTKSQVRQLGATKLLNCGFDLSSIFPPPPNLALFILSKPGPHNSNLTPPPFVLHYIPSNTIHLLAVAQLSSRYAIPPNAATTALSSLHAETPSLQARYVSITDSVIKLKSEGESINVWSLGSGGVSKVEVSRMLVASKIENKPQNDAKCTRVQTPLALLD